MLRHDSRGSGHWIHELRSNDHRHHWRLEWGTVTRITGRSLLAARTPCMRWSIRRRREKRQANGRGQKARRGKVLTFFRCQIIFLQFREQRFVSDLEDLDSSGFIAAAGVEKLIVCGPCSNLQRVVAAQTDRATSFSSDLDTPSDGHRGCSQT
jgi:hypothetical protein